MADGRWQMAVATLLVLAGVPAVASAQVARPKGAVEAPAREMVGNPALMKLSPTVTLQRQQIAALTPGLGSCPAARALADEINREAGSLVQTLSGGSKLALKPAVPRSSAESGFVALMKGHDQRLRALESRLGSMPPCDRAAATANDTKAGEHKTGSGDHNKTMKDAVRKMLEQIAEINRATNIQSD